MTYLLTLLIIYKNIFDEVDHESEPAIKLNYGILCLFHFLEALSVSVISLYLLKESMRAQCI